MPKFRRGNSIVEARQWFVGKDFPGVFTLPSATCDKSCPHKSHIHTRNGPGPLSAGDWIVTGTTGEQYIVKSDIFLANYQEVE